jgi:polysaccharide export outer membrane protein
LGFSVLGEVGRPGRYSFDRDRLTLLDALSMAGDLSIQGKRENVTVIREQGVQRMTYRINMLYADSIYSSPAFYLQQNDIVYVEPNSYRARQTTVNGNNVRSTAFWFSLASLLMTLSVLIFK